MPQSQPDQIGLDLWIDLNRLLDLFFQLESCPLRVDLYLSNILKEVFDGILRAKDRVDHLDFRFVDALLSRLSHLHVDDSSTNYLIVLYLAVHVLELHTHSLRPLHYEGLRIDAKEVCDAVPELPKVFASVYLKLEAEVRVLKEIDRFSGIVEGYDAFVLLHFKPLVPERPLLRPLLFHINGWLFPKLE